MRRVGSFFALEGMAFRVLLIEVDLNNKSIETCFLQS